MRHDLTLGTPGDLKTTGKSHAPLLHPLSWDAMIGLRSGAAALIIFAALCLPGAAGCGDDGGTGGTRCGNGILEAGEQCDGTDLAGASCSSLGEGSGQLACSASCTYDTSDCREDTCGNGTLEQGEQCDGAALGGATCSSLGHTGGFLSCDTSCQYDASGCFNCGNGILESGEECDGTDLGGATCSSQGHTGGTLSCTAGCQLDTSSCTDCGNGTLEQGEQCDGAALGGATCSSLGHTGGSLSCDTSCQYDISGCFDCGNGVLESGEECDQSDFGTDTCQTLGHTGGFLACTNDCQVVETGCFDCGNGILEAGEICDGADLGTGSCTGEGFDGGDLGCLAGCQAYDTAGCCDHGCAVAGETRCVGDMLGTCEVQTSGCRDWSEQDCSTSGQICDDTQTQAICRDPCTSDCTVQGATRCVGNMLETCSAVSSCLQWTLTEDCGTSVCGGTPAACQPSGTGAGCADVYNLNGRSYPHTVIGLWDGGALTDPGSCQTGANPLYLSYVLPESPPDRLMLRMVDHNSPVAFPQISAWTTTEEGGFCDPAQRTELGCTTAYSATGEISLDTSTMTGGEVIYFLTSGDGLSYPLLDPEVTVSTIDCSDPTDTVMVLPSTTTGVHPRQRLVFEFTGDPPLQDQGRVEIREDGVMVAWYDLSAGTSAIDWVDGRLVVVHGLEFTLGAHVLVTLQLTSSDCGTALNESFGFDVSTTTPPGGEDCTHPLPLGGSGVTAVEHYDAATLDVLDDTLVTCQPMAYAGDADSVWSFTLDPAASAVRITLNKSASNRLSAVLLDDCLAPAGALGCGSDFQTETVSVEAAGLTGGATYYLVVGNGYAGADFPDPRFTEILVEPLSPVCGNAVIEIGEECDDGSAAATGDGCSACTVEAGWVCTGEEGGTSSCEMTCSNGSLDTGEECDDGGLVPGDGCSDQCMVEPGWWCQGEPSVCHQNYVADDTVAFDWVDISPTGTSVLLGDDTFSGPVPLGFSFPFYGGAWTDVYLGSNGLLTFGAGSTSAYNYCPLTSDGSPDNLIAVMWDDLDPGDMGDPVYHQAFASCPVGSAAGACFVVQYEGYHHYPGGTSGLAGTFQAVLFSDGSVLVQYLDVGVEAGSGATVGVMGPAGTGAETYQCNQATLVNQQAVCFVAPGSTGC